jgi:hypothetical protein
MPEHLHRAITALQCELVGPGEGFTAQTSEFRSFGSSHAMGVWIITEKV